MANDAKVTFFSEALQQIDAGVQRALELTAEVVHGEVVQEQVMPFDQGHLQNDSTFVDTSESAAGHADLVSSTPYARRLYYHPEYNFSKEENPNAGAGWFDKWADGGDQNEKVQQAFAALLKREAGL